MKLEVKKENIAVLKTYLETMGKLGDEMLLSFENENLIMRIDLSGCVVGRIMLNKDFFSVFEGNDKYSIFLRDLLSYLKKIKDELIITDENNILNIKAGKSSFKTPLISELKVYPTLPELNFDSKVLITSDEYNDMISTLATIKPDVVKLIRNSGKFIVMTQNNQREAVSEITAQVDGQDDYMFVDFEYLEKLTMKGNNTIKLEFKKDFPLVASIENSNSKFELIVAPRVGEEF
jgi:hypothetical protein